MGLEPMMMFLFRLPAAYGAVLFSVVHMSALWTVWGPMRLRRSILLSLVIGVLVTVAHHPALAMSQPSFLPMMAVSVFGTWLAVAAGAAVMRGWGWQLHRRHAPHAESTSAPRGQFSIRQLLIVTVILGVWLGALRWVYISNVATGLDSKSVAVMSVSVIVILLVNVPLVLISAVTVGRGRYVLLGLAGAMLLSVGGMVPLAIITDADNWRWTLPFYIPRLLISHFSQFCCIGLAMRWLRRRGYPLERLNPEAAPRISTEQRTDEYE